MWVKTGGVSAVMSSVTSLAYGDGYLYVVGLDGTPGFLDTQWRIEKRSGDTGEIVWVKNSNPSAELDIASEVAVGLDGVYVIGNDYSPVSFSDAQARIEKRSLVDGSLLWVKVNNYSSGLTKVDYTSGIRVDGANFYTFGNDAALAADSYDSQWRIEKRLTNTGNVIWTVNYNPTPNTDGAKKIAIDNSSIYITGSVGIGSALVQDWYLEKRSLVDGSFIWSKQNMSGNVASVNHMTIDAQGIYMVGREQVSGIDQRWRIEKRSLIDGSIIWSKLRDFSIYLDDPYGVYVNSSGVYVAGYDSSVTQSNIQWRIEKFSGSDGGLIWSKTENISAGADVLQAIVGSSNALYVAGNDYSLGANPQWRIEKRELTPPNCGTVTDADGNTYDTVVIGTQCWMRENMNIGTRINSGTAQTNNSTIEKYCYNNDANNCNSPHPTYADGGLYNWDEAMQYSTTEGAQGICPDGWHIPTDAEWYTLENYLKDTGQSCGATRDNVFECSTAGTKLKSGGSSGFEGNLTGGIYAGSFFRDSSVIYWTSSKYNTGVWYRGIGVAQSGIWRNLNVFLTNGHPVRCIKDTVVAALPSGNFTNRTGCQLPDNVPNPTCNGSFSWTITNATSPNVYNVQRGDPACSTDAVGVDVQCVLNRGNNELQARDNSSVLDSVTVNADCSPASTWDAVNSMCVSTPANPAITITADPKLVRSGDKASIAVEINDASSNTYNCTVLGIDPTGTADSPSFSHTGTALVPTTNKSYLTNPISSAQIVRVECTHATLSITITKEIRVEVLPTIQEI